MGIFRGPNIIKDGLVLMLDAANLNSFKGEPTTNIIPNASNNGRFTTSNGWLTYNTNMYCDPVGSYGCGVYWYMGTTISSVSNNIVTTTSAHPFRSFDVLRPQTTGGGLTADTDYVIKKISSTEFSLHQYNSSQNGSQGYINPVTGFYKVHDAYATDTRISVNATNFPTMWWGAPHLPNSGLIKEIRNNGGVAPNTNCMRLHAYRPDGVVDGMAYGVDCPVTVGDSITLSVYLKAVDANAVGKALGYSTHFYGYDAPATTFYLGDLGVWNRYTFTWTASYTCSFISYWWPQGGTTGFSLDMADLQVEIKPYATHFTTGTRGTTFATGGGWCDLSENGNHTELSGNVLFNNSNKGALTLNGSSGFIGNSSITTSTTCTVIIFYKTTDTQELWVRGQGASDHYLAAAYPGSGYYQENVGSPTYYVDLNVTTDPVASGYKNGNYHMFEAKNVNFSTWTSFQWFLYGGVWNLIGDVSLILVYNRNLTTQESQQNFNAYKGRFGL